MKKKIIVYLGLLSIAISTIPFIVYKFYFKGSFSIQNSDWGDFGSFIGGTTGALLSTLSLLVLIYTLFVTMKNAELQISNQQDNHEAQLENQQKHHNEQLKLQQQHHEENLKLQREIHNRERDLARLPINLSLLNGHIDTLNNILNSRKYHIFSQIANDYVTHRQDSAIQALSSQLNFILETEPEKKSQAPFEVIKIVRISFQEEMYPFARIMGIIINEKNDNFRGNYREILKGSTNRDMVYWLMCFAMMHIEEIRLAIEKDPLLLPVPTEVYEIFHNHGIDPNIAPFLPPRTQILNNNHTHSTHNDLIFM